MTLDKLIALTDEQALVRLGLELMELFARAEGRSLWHLAEMGPLRRS